MPQKESRGGRPGVSLVAFLSFFWILLLGLVPLLFSLDKEGPYLDEDREIIQLDTPFSLLGTPPSSFAATGSGLVRLEEEGLAFLDAAGREEAFVSYPYREARLIFLEDALLVAPDRGGGLMLVEGAARGLEMDTAEAVQGAAYRDGLLLTFGPSGQGKMVLMVYEVPSGSQRSALVLEALQWPLAVSFVPTAQAFDLVLLDLSEGTALTRILRFDLEGQVLFNRTYPGDGPLPGLAYPGSGQVALYNDRQLVLLDPGTGEAAQALLPGKLIRVAKGGGRLAFLVLDEGEEKLFLVREGGEGDLFFSPPEGRGLTLLALAPDGSALLGAKGDELRVMDPGSGDLVGQKSFEENITGLLALDSHHFLIFLEKQAVLATMK